MLLIFWLGTIFLLSSQNGLETTSLSMSIARKLAGFLWENATRSQIARLHLLLRKLAHVFLYAVLGLMAAMFWDLVLDRVPAFVRAGTAILCCAGIGFLDERLKIFVPGRHYDVTEFYLNAAAAAVIIVLYFILVWLLWRRRRRKRE